MSQAIRVVACPRCGASVRWGEESPFRPFCSERCKTVDLGAWAKEEYRVAVTEQDADAPPGPPSEPPQA